jgi:hypothetical protein
MDQTRITQLRYWAALNDHAMEAHGTDAGVAARNQANRVSDALGDFTEADWGVIRNTQRAYQRESDEAFHG